MIIKSCSFERVWHSLSLTTTAPSLRRTYVLITNFLHRLRILLLTIFWKVGMAVKLQPLSDWVVAKQEEAVTKTASGLYLPDKAAEKPKVAKVLAIGPGKVGDDNERVKMTVKVGDRIVYKEYSTTELKIDGKEYILVREDDILAIVK
jgi:chaperonin GroES